ncbi:MAG: ABC transporter permease [Parvibaculaceae bacterium]
MKILREIAGPLAALVLVAILVGLTTDRFFNPGNISNLILQVSIVAIVAVGSTIVIFSGGIDLSPGSAIALLTMVFAVSHRDLGLPLFVVVPVVVALGAALGLVNGVLIAYLRIPSFITTLAALSAFRGAAFMFNNGSPISSLSPRLEPLFYGTLAGIPAPMFYVAAIYGLAFWFLRHTVWGRAIYAVGGNANAARLSGIAVRKTQLVAFVIAGAMAGAGAVLMVARLNSGSPNYGVGLELSAIAAAVVGGASLAGGRGNIINTIVGALTIVIVQNALNLNAVPTSVQNVVIGAIIVLAVGIDMWRAELAHFIRRAVAGAKST